MLEMVRHSMTTAREKAGEGGVLEEERARLVAAAEALLPLEILRGQKQREQFVLTHVAKVVAMTSTNITIQFSEVQPHFDVLIVDEVSHLPKLETGLLFIPLSSNVFPTIVRV